MVKLSVIIVNYNVQYFLEQCILSIQAASKNISIEIIVVDNNSTDGSCSMLHKNFPDVQLIANIENVGFSKANNQGVRKTCGEYILILNPDTVIAEDTLEKIIDFAEKQSNLGALGARFIDGSGEFLPECKRNIPTVKIASQKIRGNSKKYYANHISENEIAKIEILTGAFMFIKRDTFLKIEGFDEDYFMYGEDIDLCYKLLNKGYQNFYFGTSTIIHYKGESTIKNISNFKHFYGAMQIFYAKHFKINSFNSFSANVLFKILILYNSFKRKIIKVGDSVNNNLLFIGNNQETFEMIKQNVVFQESQISEIITDNISDFDMVIFDNNFISNKDIIDNFQKLKFQNISKKIIPKGTNFYLGSNSSSSLGKAIEFN